MLNSQHLNAVQNQLSQFAAQNNFNEIITTAFGNQVDQTQLEILQKQLLAGDFSIIPDIQILLNGELGSANGAYAADLDKIFVSSDFLTTASAKAVSFMLIEEIGHRIDKLLNNNLDSPGDEGEIFSLLVNGNNLSAEILSKLKSQNDHGEIVLSETYLGQVIERKVAIEKQNITGTEGDDNVINFNALNGLVSETNLIKGLGGNDDIFAGDKGDIIEGGAGNDTIYGSVGIDTIYGGIGNDTIYGGIANDNLYGGIGNDTLFGSGGGDSLYGGLDDDTYNVISSSFTSDSGSIISDIGGSDDILRLTKEIGAKVPLSSGGLANGLTGFQRKGTDLIIDLDQNGIASPEDDLSIINFFNDAGGAGSGFIETVENLSGNAILDLSSKNQIRIDIFSQNQKGLSEVGMFKVDDDLGTIDGIKPTDAGYLDAALKRFQIVSSIIQSDKVPPGYDFTTTRTLTTNAGDIVRFGFVKDTSIDALRQNPKLASSLILSAPVSTLTPGAIAIAWESPIGVDLTAKVNEYAAPSLGVNTQTSSQGELLDFRTSTTNISATFSVYREAAYNNSIYFYAVSDETGVIFDPVSKQSLKPTDAGYLEVAIRNALPDINLSNANQGETTATAIFNKGGIYAPIIVANGNKDAFLDSNPGNNPDAYTPFTLGNADKVDHVRLFGNNTFGFEDLKGGGDLDYNDMIVKVALSPVV
jgi:Domain of unknown function (DUF4114)/RTX calcium-binding nonapeptide repeat (4 copies)